MLLLIATLAALLIAAGLRIMNRPDVSIDCANPGQVNTDYKTIRWNKGN